MNKLISNTQITLVQSNLHFTTLTLVFYLVYVINSWIFSMHSVILSTENGFIIVYRCLLLIKTLLLVNYINNDIIGEWLLFDLAFITVSHKLRLFLNILWFE